uniref:Uncharacterized protein n=2 Tax=Timema TaxID=61471 RepID=A0A7R9DIF1_TIMPO|nr:unnamed protein product [Timema douglasi]CAD7415310.1 unnamed protein product [Timema poppensis]
MDHGKENKKEREKLMVFKRKIIREGFPNQRYDRARETFQLAINLGSRSKNQSTCHQKFKKCPFTTSQMLKIMRLPLSTLQ